MTKEDLKLLQSINGDTEWQKIEHGVVCGLDKLIIIAAAADEIKAIATELLDARARIPRVSKEVVIMDGEGLEPPKTYAS